MNMKRPGLRRGMTLLEVMVGIMILGITVVVASALFPTSSVLRDRASNFSRASVLAQRKLDQVRDLPVSQINETTLLSRGWVDSSGVRSGSNVETSFTTCDRLTSDLPGATGQVLLKNTGTDMVTVEVIIRWRNYTGKQEEVRAVSAVSEKQKSYKENDALAL
jgi:prepilin-type N-terminal cleavage/methylation domain-containing protein